ncbi:oligosaccharide flippase family protein [Pedobacter sp. P351]|uniref:lipopolysaccharide biosynthesis protein n=1 Tax=Pedobacter superstes TaxID=3133441 RepID=UPI0030A1B4CE
MSTLKKFAGQTAIYGVSTVFSRILGFLLTPIYVSAYPAKIYGVFTVMFTWASLFNAVLALGMETTFFRYLNKNENDKQKVYNNAFIVIASVSIVFLSVALLFAHSIAEWMQDDATTKVEDYASYIRYFIFILVVDGLSVIPFARVRADGKPLRYGIIKLTNILIFVSFNLLFILVIPKLIESGSAMATYFSWYREGWIGYVFISNLIASVVTLILLLPEFLKLQLKADWSFIREMLVYSIPVFIANMSFLINENLDKIFLEKLLPPGVGDEQVGIYGACCKLALFLSIFINAFRLGAEPFFFSHQKNKNSAQTYASIMNYFVIAVSLIFVAVVANIEILKYFIGSDDPEQKELYWSGLKVVPILLFGYVSLGIYMNLSIWYKLSDQTRYGLYISGVGAIVTIVMNILFIPQYGYIASAWISLSAYTSMMVLSYILGQKNYPIPYNLKKNLGYLSISVILVILSFHVFDRNLIIGNGLLFIFIIGAYLIERKELTAIFNENSSNK